MLTKSSVLDKGLSCQAIAYIRLLAGLPVGYGGSHLLMGSLSLLYIMAERMYNEILKSSMHKMKPDRGVQHDIF